MTVPSGRIVERLDVFCDRVAGNQAVLVDLFLDVLLLQTAEEGLGNRIDAPSSFLDGSCLGSAHSSYRTSANRRFRTESPDPSG